MIPDHEIDRMICDKIIGYDPYDPDLLNPASIDMRLHPVIRVPKEFRWGTYPTLDTAEIAPGHTEPWSMSATGRYRVDPGKFILASTVETVALPDDMVSRVEGKSSIGRIGLAVHITAGFIDPGFTGQVTLEIANLSPWPIVLREGMRIAQMAFMPMNSSAARPYSVTGHYQGQDGGPVESRYRIPELSCMGAPWCADGVHDGECYQANLE